MLSEGTLSRRPGIQSPLVTWRNRRWSGRPCRGCGIQSPPWMGEGALGERCHSNIPVFFWGGGDFGHSTCSSIPAGALARGPRAIIRVTTSLPIRSHGIFVGDIFVDVIPGFAFMRVHPSALRIFAFRGCFSFFGGVLVARRIMRTIASVLLAFGMIAGLAGCSPFSEADRMARCVTSGFVDCDEAPQQTDLAKPDQENR